jgi:predicted transcriptional regulator
MGLIPVIPEGNEVCMGLLQALYVNRGRAPGYSSERLADALEFNRDDVSSYLKKLVTDGLVDEVPEGFRLSDKGYDALYQRESSYCPYL